MKGLEYSDIDPEFEDELRAMLRRRAADVHPNPPDWQDLVRRSGAVVVSLHTGRKVNGTPVRPGGRGPSWAWLRPALAAAACLLVVMAAGIVIGRSTDSPGSGGAADQPEDDVASPNEVATEQMVPAPGEVDYAPGVAAALYPQRSESELRVQLEESGGRLSGDLASMSNTVAVTQEYLSSVGISDEAPQPPYELWIDEPDDGRQLSTGPDGDMVETTRVWWSLRVPDGTTHAPIVTIGYVFLRNLVSPADTTSDAWMVVGAATQGLDLAEVRRDGDQLSFKVTSYRSSQADVETSGLPVDVLVNDQQINDDESPESNQTTEFTHDIPADQPVTIRLQQRDPQLDPEFRLSIVETKLLPEPDSAVPVTTDPVLPPGGAPTGDGMSVARIGDDCAPSVNMTLSLELPSGFARDALPGDGRGTEPESLSCVVHFANESDPSAVITVAWGEPEFPVPELLGPTCFRWAATDDGGFIAVRSAPQPIYMTAEGFTEADFELAVTTSILGGTSIWTADQGC